jgi:hypothetical protein
MIDDVFDLQLQFGTDGVAPVCSSCPQSSKDLPDAWEPALIIQDRGRIRIAGQGTPL